MKIITTIAVSVEKAGGEAATLIRTTQMSTGDNPRFERDGVRGALQRAHVEFVEVNHLEGEEAL